MWHRKASSICASCGRASVRSMSSTIVSKESQKKNNTSFTCASWTSAASFLMHCFSFDITIEIVRQRRSLRECSDVCITAVIVSREFELNPTSECRFASWVDMRRLRSNTYRDISCIVHTIEACMSIRRCIKLLNTTG